MRSAKLTISRFSLGVPRILHRCALQNDKEWEFPCCLPHGAYPEFGMTGQMAHHELDLAGIASDGVVALFYASDAGLVYVTERTGSWCNSASWSNSASSITGMACVYDGDWNLVITGQDSNNDFKVWTCIHGDGSSQGAGTWSSLMELTSASDGSSVEFHVPFVGKPDVYRMYFTEKYTGPTPYAQINWSHSLASATFDQNLWREPVPFDLSSNYGVALAYGGGYLRLSTPSGVWRGSLSASPVDLSDDVLSLRLKEGPDGGHVVITMRNDDGRYGGIGSGAYASLRKGSEVQVSPGYMTSSGGEASTGPAYWVEGWEYASKNGTSKFILYARSAWSLLGNWKARRQQYAWAIGEASVMDIVTFVMARAGLEVEVVSASQAITTYKPAFTIQPEERGTSAVGRLMYMVPDILIFRGATAYIMNIQSTDATDYSYGTDHALLEGHYLSYAQEINRVQVYGAGILEEVFSWSSVEDVHDRLLQIHDLNADTTAKAQDRGNAAMRSEVLSTRNGEILVPTNCGQELLDMLEITDANAGLNATKYRVASIALEYDREQRARYVQRLGLTAVIARYGKVRRNFYLPSASYGLRHLVSESVFSVRILDEDTSRSAGNKTQGAMEKWKYVKGLLRASTPVCTRRRCR